MASNFQTWLSQGDSLYQTALKEFHAIETQLDELEGKLLSKQAEVNQIAAVLGKPTVEASRKGVNGQAAAVATVPQIMDEIERSQPAPSNANIARALTGRFGR